jgi:hypothetical protein
LSLRCLWGSFLFPLVPGRQSDLMRMIAGIAKDNHGLFALFDLHALPGCCMHAQPLPVVDQRRDSYFSQRALARRTPGSRTRVECPAETLRYLFYLPCPHKVLTPRDTSDPGSNCVFPYFFMSGLSCDGASEEARGAHVFYAANRHAAGAVVVLRVCQSLCRFASLLHTMSACAAVGFVACRSSHMEHKDTTTDDTRQEGHCIHPFP